VIWTGAEVAVAPEVAVTAEMPRFSSTISLSSCIGGQNLSLEPLPPCLHLRPLLRQLLNTGGFHAGKMPPNAPRRKLAFALRDGGQVEVALLHSN
jgi:hypothetical protein